MHFPTDYYFFYFRPLLWWILSKNLIGPMYQQSQVKDLTVSLFLYLNIIYLISIKCLNTIIVLCELILMRQFFLFIVLFHISTLVLTDFLS
jgi:hypothetical protein